MKVEKIYTDNSFNSNFSGYRCSNCGLIYTNEEKAEECCKPVKCSVCGREIVTDKTKCREYYYHDEDGNILCSSCQRKRFEDSWEVLTEEEYWKRVHAEGSTYGPVCDDDKWFTDLSEAIDDLYDSDWWETEEDLKQVRFQVGEIMKPVQLRIDRLLEWETEELNIEDPDCDTIWNDLEGLYKFMKEWNEKQSFRIWDRRNMWVTLSEKTINELLEDAGIKA